MSDLLQFPTPSAADVVTLEQAINTEMSCQKVPDGAYSAGAMALVLGSYRLVVAELNRVAPENALLRRVLCLPSSKPSSDPFQPPFPEAT